MATTSGAAHRRHARTSLGVNGVTAELTVGLLLLATAAVAGFAFVHRPWPNRLDVAGFAAFPAAPDSRGWHLIADVGSVPVLVVGIVICALCSAFRDRARALSCVVAPGVAVLVTEQIAKPLVGRHVTALGGYSYPSGTVTAAAALATIAVLAVPMLVKPFVFVVGLLAVVAVSAAVIAMRWHFPTDTLGGACVGAGSVLFLDALFHLPGLVGAATRRSRAGPARSTVHKSRTAARQLDEARFG